MNSTAKSEVPNINPLLWSALAQSFFIPLLFVVFFGSVAPHWLNNRVKWALAKSIYRTPGYSNEFKKERITAVQDLDFRTIWTRCPPGSEGLRDSLIQLRIRRHFDELRWANYASWCLLGCLGVGAAVLFLLSHRGSVVSSALLNAYSLGWRLTIAVSLFSVLLFNLLAAFGLFELTMLLWDNYIPRLIIFFLGGGILAFGLSCWALLKKVPLEFEEKFSLELTPNDAPDLWLIVRHAAATLNTSIPDHIVIGMQLNFYVTEMAVRHNTGKTGGKTLYMSLPLLRALTPEQALAVIGHELAHFIGEDTRISRYLYPLRRRIRETLNIFGHIKWSGWPAFNFQSVFVLLFEQALQNVSRRRELLADQVGASLTSPESQAQALIKVHVMPEAFKIAAYDVAIHQRHPAFELPLADIVRDHLMGQEAFWTQLLASQTQHPLDSHPPLHIRLAALGHSIQPDDVKIIATQTKMNAAASWLKAKDALFTEIQGQAQQAIDVIRERQAAAAANLEQIKRNAPPYIKYNWLAQSVGILALLVSTILFWMILPSIELREINLGQILPLSIGGAFGLLLLVLPAEFFTRRMYFDTERIRIVSAWKKTREIHWDDVISFGFYPAKREWRLVTKSLGTIKPSTMLKGLIYLQFLAEEKNKVPASKTQIN